MQRIERYCQITREELTNHYIVKRYREMLNGIYRTMPANTWNNDEYVIYIIRYVLEIKLGLTTEEIPKINKQVIQENKLWGVLNRFKSVKKLINFVYPSRYNEFDFHRVPTDYWSNIENIRKRLEYHLEKDGYNFEDIPAVITYSQLINWGLSNPLKRHDDSPYKLINTIYPNRFKQTEFSSLPQRTSRNKALLRTMFIEMLFKENIPFEGAPLLITQEMLVKYKFTSALKLHENSPSKLILSLFPNDFTQDNFRKTNGYWKNQDNVRKAIGLLVKQQKIPFESIPKYFTKSFLKKNELSGLLHMYNGSPIQIIDMVYPGQFNVTDFVRVPNRYWYSKENRINGLRSYCKSRNISRDFIPKLNRAYFRKHFPRFISLVDRHYDSKFYLWIIESFPEYDFKPKEFNLLISKDKQICDSKEELAIHDFLFEHIKDVNIVREGKRFFNKLSKEMYIPDWIVYQGDKKVIIEYFGLYGSKRCIGYKEKSNRKVDFFKANKEYEFVPIFPEDFRSIGFDRIKELLDDVEIELIKS